MNTIIRPRLAIKRYPLFWGSLLLIASFLFSLCKGSASIPIDQLFFASNEYNLRILLDLRLPRTLTALVTGGALGLAGTLLQLLLQNPLADPYVLGVSSSAAFFMLLFSFLGLSQIYLLGGAGVGSICAMLLMLMFCYKHRWQPQTLLLMGIAIASIASAGITLLLLISENEYLHGMLFWLAGDLNVTTIPWFGMLTLFFVFLLSFCLAPGFNVLANGEKEAFALGLSIQQFRVFLYFLSAVLTALAVTLAGCVGFIGLIIPHVATFLGGYDYRKRIPLSLMLGGALLMFADTLARTIVAPIQLPVGLMMTLIGVPIFIGLLGR